MIFLFGVFVTLLTMKLRLSNSLYRYLLASAALFVTLSTGSYAADLEVDDVAALYFGDNGLTASGEARIRRTGNWSRNYSYTWYEYGSFNGATWQTSSSTYGTSASYWWGDSTLSFTKSSGNTYYATSSDGISDSISRIVLAEGRSLYLGGENNTYNGTIDIVTSDTDDDDYAIIGTYTTTADTYNLGKLTGEGVVLLQGLNTSDTTTFNFQSTDTSDWFSGTVKMTANGGGIAVRINGEQWQNTVFNFERNATLSSSPVDTSGEAPASQTLTLSADATVKGLDSGSSYATVSGAHTLTLGTDDAKSYTYTGSLSSGLNINKIGSNTQAFEKAATLAAVEVQNGTLQFSNTATISGAANIQGGKMSVGGVLKAGSLNHTGGTLETASDVTVTNQAQFSGVSDTITGTLSAGSLSLTDASLEVSENVNVGGEVSLSGGVLNVKGDFDADSLTLQSGTLTTQGAVMLNSAALYGGTTWNLGSDWAGSGVDLTLHNMSAGAITFASDSGASWTFSQNLDLSDVGATAYSQPLFTMDGVHLHLGESFTLSGVYDGMSVGDTIVLASLSRGATADYANTALTLSSGTSEYQAQLSTVNDQVVLTLTGIVVPTTTVESGQKLWIHSFAGQSGHEDGELEGLSNASFNSGSYSWSGTSVTNQAELRNLVLNAGSQVHFRKGKSNVANYWSHTNADHILEYDGNIRVQTGDGEAARFVPETTWVRMTMSGKLEGSGALKLVTNASSDWNSVISFTAKENTAEPWFSGELALRAPRGGVLQMNVGNIAGDTRWRNVVFNLNNATADTESILTGSEQKVAKDLVLGVVGDAQIAGIVGDSANAGLVGDGGSHTLTIGAADDSRYVFAGRVGNGTFYRGGNKSGTDQGGLPPITPEAGMLSITKIGTNTQIFSGEADVQTVTLNGGTLQFDGSLNAENITLRGGTFISNGELTSQNLTLYGAAEWQMGGTTTTVFADFIMNDTPFLVTGTGNDVSWTLGGTFHLNNAGMSSSTAPFLTMEHLNLSIGSYLTVRGVHLAEGQDKVALFNFSSGDFDFGSYESASIRTPDGGSYTGKLVLEDGVVYISNLVKDIDWPPCIDETTGFIWSGERNGTSPGDSQHRALVMGKVWRADGSDDNTGWHEQAVEGGVAGVYVNGNKVTFGDYSFHADEKVEKEGRIVDISGRVAPGLIHVTADEALGEMYGGSEAQLKFGYALDGMDKESFITDVMDAAGNVITPTRIVKDGKALLILAANNTFTGGVDVNQGGLYLASVGAAGTGTLRFHTDNEWNYDVYDSINEEWDSLAKRGGELMVCYIHSNEHASGYRSPSVKNDIVLVDNDPSKAGRFTLSFGTSAYEHSSGNDDHANVPRHWRQLTLSGALHVEGTPSKDDELVLAGYCSTYTNYSDQSFVTTVVMNEHDVSDKSLKSNFSGTVVMKNTLNTSPLDSNLVGDSTAGRTGGSVQLMLTGDKLQMAHLDMTRESVSSEELKSLYGIDETNTRQTYNNILVLSGTTNLRGLSADFCGKGWIFTPDGTSQATKTFETLAQNEEVWHVRTVANSNAVLRLGLYEDDNSAKYVYSGALGYEQSYTELSQGHVMWGDGFDAPLTNEDGSLKTDDAFYRQASGVYSMGLPTISLIKRNGATQYIHTAKLNDILLYGGTLGFNSLDLQGNLNIVGGSILHLGATSDSTDGAVNWNDISEGTTSSFETMDGRTYRVVATSETVSVESSKTFTVYTSDSYGSENNLPVAAEVKGNVDLKVGSALTFRVNNVLPSTDRNYVLLNVDGNLNLVNDPTNVTINFSGVDFSTVDFENKTYYLAAANEIVVDGGDSSGFSDRLISLGYGYFGVLDTLDDSVLSVAQASGDNRDYLVMQVSGDPRRTWSGMSSREPSYTWFSSANVPANEYDYRWKENTAFEDGQVVLFGNLYQPVEWEEDARLLSAQTVDVLSNPLHPGTTVAAGESGFAVDDRGEYAEGFQKVQIVGNVAPVSIIINSEYVQSGNPMEDGTNYYFFGDGHIVDAESSVLQQHGFDGAWKTALLKMGSGVAVIATDNSFSGGSELSGGAIVMQHQNALGTGKITITNGATLQGDFTDSFTQDELDAFAGAYEGEGMMTSTVLNPVEVNTYVDPDNPEYDLEIDARIANAHDRKMVLTSLTGESDTVVTLYGISAPTSGDDMITLEGGERPAYTYAVFKVLDPSRFYGAVRMDGNLWGAAADTDGGKVQLEIMTTEKSDTGADWLNTDIDLSVNKGTERTVLALDAIEGATYSLTQEALINSLNGTGTVRMADGAINSSVVNMSEEKHITLVIKGLDNGDYDGVLGYGEFQRTTDYGTEHREDIPLVGETCHHYGCGTFGDLNIRKEGNTTQSVYNAWLDELYVQGGTFIVDKSLMVSTIRAGAGQRLFVGEVNDFATVYALTVGKGGILSMDTHLFDSNGQKHDAWETIQPGVLADNEAWVKLQDGATLTAHTDWYTDTQVELTYGAAVTVNAHNYTPDPYITSDHADHAHIDESGEAHEHFNHFNSSHIIQLLGDFLGHNVNLTFTNEQISPGANEQEKFGSDFMGYVAIKDHNQMSGELTVKEQTVLQILQSKTKDAAMNATIDGTDAAMQVVEAAQSQYINNLTVKNDGALLLGGVEKTSLGSGEAALRSIDYGAEAIQLSVSNRDASIGTMNNIHTELSGTAARIGGSEVQQSVANQVHLTAHSAEGTHSLHHADMLSSLVELEKNVSLDIHESVLVDQNSIVFGDAGVAVQPRAAVSASLQEFADVRPVQTSERINTGISTTVELTVSGGDVYKTADKGIYHVYANQLHNLDVYGDGLTIQLASSDIISAAQQNGCRYVAIQISGTGQFHYEDSLGNFTIDQRKLLSVSGTDITDLWVSSATVAADTGVAVSNNMLYIYAVPEPATTTLSLLALTGLAMRRRRR